MSPIPYSYAYPWRGFRFATFVAAAAVRVAPGVAPMENGWGLARRGQLRRIDGFRRPRVLLVDADLGRRATLPVALGTRYEVETAATIDEALTRAVAVVFDVALLDAGALGGALPRIVRVLRGRSRGIRLVVIAGRRDLRGRHYAATLGVDAVLGRPAPAHALLDRVEALVALGARRPPFDRGVGRAIDLMARDVIHLLDVTALADATGVPLPRLAERFRADTGLGVREYVIRVRVTVAEQLLRDTDLGVGTLAEILGFADEDELARVFSARAGRPPEAYRLASRAFPPR
jgi:AraC-like DNA-binding protein